jgi:hypothetical protein
MSTETKHAWYVASTGNHQGLVIEEKTGRNIAVTYDKADAPLIAAAPELLGALITMVEQAGCYMDDGEATDEEKAAMDAARGAIAKAKGNV